MPHCGGQGAGGAGRGRVVPPPARPPGFIEAQNIERDEWILISLIAIAIFVFMQWILVFGTVTASLILLIIAFFDDYELRSSTWL